VVLTGYRYTTTLLYAIIHSKDRTLRDLCEVLPAARHIAGHFGDRPIGVLIRLIYRCELVDISRHEQRTAIYSQA